MIRAAGAFLEVILVDDCISMSRTPGPILASASGGRGLVARMVENSIALNSSNSRRFLETRDMMMMFLLFHNDVIVLVVL